MTEWKSTNPTLSSSQSSIAAMKNFLADGRFHSPPSSPPPHPLAHPPTTPIPPAWPDVGNGGGQRVRQGNTSPAGQHYYRGRNAILTQSLHLKYTCGKRTNADCSLFVFPL